jgi:hypothetical protein
LAYCQRWFHWPFVWPIRRGLLHRPSRLASPIRIAYLADRARACQVLGIKPGMILGNGTGDIVDYNVSAKLHRRHLTASQRAMVAAKLANITHGGGRNFKTGMPVLKNERAISEACGTPVLTVAKQMNVHQGAIIQVYQRLLQVPAGRYLKLQG